jgi:hypothetical protein
LIFVKPAQVDRKRPTCGCQIDTLRHGQVWLTLAMWAGLLLH